MRPELPVGFHAFSRNAFINYQLNRRHSLGYTRREDLAEAGRRIRRFEDNKPVFLEMADRARHEGRLKNAAFYVRAAEFLTDPEDPDNTALYTRFRSEFYTAFAQDGIEQLAVPFADSTIPASRLRAVGARSVTDRVFTRAENAENHCQMGNLALALETITARLDRAQQGVTPEQR